MQPTSSVRRRPNRPRIPPAFAILDALAFAFLLIGAAHAQAPNAVPFDAIVITATRQPTLTFDVGAAIDLVPLDRITQSPRTLAEALEAVPGIAVHDRQNYAQDVQIAVRGFGARSSFGVRGVRLYVDGIPATLPDGQGQTSNIDLDAIDHIEVLRGPFSALYGNSSGGVVSLFTATGQGAPVLRTGFLAGSFNALNLFTGVVGSDGPLHYNLSTSHFESDGYRLHSGVVRDLSNAKLVLGEEASGRWTLILNGVALEAQDPGGLTAAEFARNPHAVDVSTTLFDTRKRVDQSQGGLAYDQTLSSDDRLHLLVYAGHRSTEQFQAIPLGPQHNPLNPGGVIALGRDFGGLDANVTHDVKLAAIPIALTAGLAVDGLNEHRLGYQNFLGGQLGVVGALRRNEDNRVDNVDPYLQASALLLPAVTATVGVREVDVRFRSDDHYVTPTNPNDSGSLHYQATTPIAGLAWRVSSGLNTYINIGRGFETPTLNELAYRADGASGLNFGLSPDTTTSAELGAKLQVLDNTALSAALFDARTAHELVTESNVDGRSTYQNAGRTEREGLEFNWTSRWHAYLVATFDYTLLAATYQQAFLTCTATPCAQPTVLIAAGSRIPGISRNAASASLAWQPPSGWTANVQMQGVSRLYANDTNTAAAGGWGALGTTLAYVAPMGSITVTTLVRGDNLLNRRYAGSVIVDESNARYFESAPGRNYAAGVTISARF